MKRILIVSLNSGGTMGHGKIISSLANFLSKSNKHVTILSDMPFSNNFELDKRVTLKNIRVLPHENYTIGGLCNCSQKEEIYQYALENEIETVIFSTFFDLELVKKFKSNNIKTILLSYPIRDTYRLALQQNGAYASFDRVITLYGPCMTDKEMKNESFVNPLDLVKLKNNKDKPYDILVTCGGGGRPSSNIFLKKALKALNSVIKSKPETRAKIIKGNSKVEIKAENIESVVWSKNFANQLSAATTVISEAGYFTMLDLINNNKRAIFVPGERIIDNQELRALKLVEAGMGSIFFPFEKPSKLANLILEGLEQTPSRKDNSIKAKIEKYPELGKKMLEELK